MFAMRMLAYCGLYCEQCAVRTAFVEQDWKHIAGLPGKYKKEGARLSDYACECCKGANLCGPCGIKDCAVPRNIDSCADCGDFPCAVIEAFANDGVPHHRQAMNNLLAIRENGVEAWFATLTPAIRCACGERQSWYCICPKHS